MIERQRDDDHVIREFWRQVQGPGAELTGPLIRFAGLVRARAWEEAATEAEQYAASESRAGQMTHRSAALKVFAQRLRCLASDEGEPS